VRLAVSIGDPAGIGPEVALRAAALARDELPGVHPLLVGDSVLLGEAARRLGLPEPSAEDVHALPASAAGPDSLLELLFAGRATKAGGQTAAACVRAAMALVQAGEADALVTAPLNKEGLALAGEPYPGHTELLGQELGAPRVRMMLAGGPLRVVLVTTHHALRDVPELITQPLVLETLRVADEALAPVVTHGGRPRLALAALNPHAGEAGRFGREEIEVLAPAVAQAQAEGLAVTGPHPADTLFGRAAQPDAPIDAVIALYHDQGLIPVKLAAFGRATNVSLGLPIVRTSPDHGTAYDIAGQGLADPGSMLEAMRVAADMVRLKRAAFPHR
jgi:4-hydroxythreonine-4-phosphate dehydrogenase